MSAKFKITKNTWPKELKIYEQQIKSRGRLAVKRGLEVIRNNVVNSPEMPVVTSRYKNSWQPDGVGTREDKVFSIESKKDDTVIIGTLGTNVPYAARLELGFVGADSLGRNYNQPARYIATNAFNSSVGDVYKVIVNTLNGK